MPVRNPNCATTGCVENGMCEGCFQQATIALAHKAAMLGRAWALGILRRRKDLCDPWPRWEQHGKVAAIARDKVRHLTRDPALLDWMAERCSSEAGMVWTRPERWLGSGR